MLEVYLSDGRTLTFDWDIIRPLLTPGLLKLQKKYEYNFLMLRDLKNEWDFLEWCVCNSKSKHINAIALGHGRKGL